VIEISRISLRKLKFNKIVDEMGLNENQNNLEKVYFVLQQQKSQLLKNLSFVSKTQKLHYGLFKDLRIF